MFYKGQLKKIDLELKFLKTCFIGRIIMKLVETAINHDGESYVYSITEPNGWELPGHLITDFYFSKQSPPLMLATTDELKDKNFNLQPGEVRFFRSDIGPTKTVHEFVKLEAANIPLKKMFYHSTTTVDYIVILKGPVVLIVNDEEIVLQTGDCVIQRGAAHAWHNYSDETVTITGIMIGVETPTQFVRTDTVGSN